jgi:hypothetical protein
MKKSKMMVICLGDQKMGNAALALLSGERRGRSSRTGSEKIVGF